MSLYGLGRDGSVMVWKRPMFPDLMIELMRRKGMRIVRAAGSMARIPEGSRPTHSEAAMRCVRMSLRWLRAVGDFGDWS